MPTPIYEQMVDEARERGSTIPDGTPEALAWAGDARVTYGGHHDWPSPRPRLALAFPPGDGIDSAAVQDEGAPD